MRKPLSEIEKYESAGEEEDVLDFVKQFEMCDVCNEPENPKQKCLNCNWFICEKCVPFHRVFKPSHEFVKLLSTDKKGNEQNAIVKICTKHPGQVADLFCIVCHRILCVHCRDYSHRECLNSVEKSYVKSIFRSYHFLQEYIQAKQEQNETDSGSVCNYTEETEGYTEERDLSRIVHIKGIAKLAYEWLKKIYEKLTECVNFLRKYKFGFHKAICEVSTRMLELHLNQLQFHQKRIDYAVDKSEELQTQTAGLLKMPADIDTVFHLLRNEKKYVLPFHLKRKFQFEPQLLEVNTTSLAGDMVSMRFTSECFIHNVGNISKGILATRITPKTHDRCCDLQNNYMEGSGSATIKYSQESTCMHDQGESHLLKDVSTFRASVVSTNGKNATIHERKRQYLGKHFQKEGKKDRIPVSYDEIDSNITSSRDDLISPNGILQEAEDMPLCEKHCKVHEISYGYTYNKGNLSYQFYGKRDHNNIILKHIELPMILTYFENIFITHPVFKVSKHAKIHVFTGNRKGGRLETMLVFCETKASQTAFKYVPKYAICILAPQAKFYSTEERKKAATKEKFDCLTVNDKSKVFSLALTSHVKQGQVTKHKASSYQTKMTKSLVPTNLLYWTNIKFTDPKSSKTPNYPRVPVTKVKLEIFCVFEDRFYFVSRESQTSLAVGILIMTPDDMQLDTRRLIKQEEIPEDLPIDQIKPLTMTKLATEEIIVVCSVRNDNSMLVMIRPEKTDTSPIELLRVCYPTSAEIAETWIEELEMSPQGDIVYILRNEKGMSHSVITKYLIEEFVEE